MAARPDYVKIGLFVLLGLGAAVATAIAIGARSLHKVTISYVTYFNESVTGLEVGAPVKARGVTIGQIGDITFAPDHRMIEVRSDINIGALEHLGLRPVGLPATVSDTPADLRARLVSQGLTGNVFLGLDFVDPEKSPPPKLPFTTPERYIPAARGVQRGFQESAAEAMEGMAEIVDTLVEQRFSDKVMDATRHVDQASGAIDRIIESVDSQNIPERGASTLEELNVAARKINKVLDHLDGESGLVAAAKRSIDSIGDVGRNTTGATRNLDETLAEIREAAGAIRLLAEEVERDPDMLLKGRAKRRSP